MALLIGCEGGPSGSSDTAAPATVAALAASPGADEFLARNAFEGFASLTDRSLGQNRYLVFTSRGALLPTDTNGRRDIYLRDLRTGQMKVVSVASDGTQGNADSTQASISADGRFVVFRSAATNLVAGDSNATADIFLHVVATGVTTRVSTSTVGGQSNGASQTPAVSAGGRFVVFASVATNLTTADNNGVQDIFLKDTSTGATTLVSSNSALTESANGASHDPAITGGSAVEGEFIAFSTEATDIIAGGLNGQRQIVLIKRENPSSRELVSQSALGAQADDPEADGGFGHDGPFVGSRLCASN